MMMTDKMILVNSGAQLSEAVLTEFENEYNLKLPEDYKSFLLKNNGGITEDDWAFEFIETTGSKATSTVINYFYILFSEETIRNTDLKVTLSSLIKSNSLAPGLLPIAFDVFGNTICIYAGDNGHGKICITNHELEDPETGYMVMSKVAESFSEFIDKCYIYDD